jgi:hypothetical protein
MLDIPFTLNWSQICADIRIAKLLCLFGVEEKTTIRRKRTIITYPPISWQWKECSYGTVSRDFSSPVLVFKQLLAHVTTNFCILTERDVDTDMNKDMDTDVNIDMNTNLNTSRDYFEFFRIFVELFLFVIDSPVMNTPGKSIRILG